MKRVVAIVAVLAALGGLGHVATAEVIGHAETRASDALPLYLSSAAVAAGLDPTQEASLAQVYDERGMTVGAATFSTLYPATAGVVLRPFAGLDWAAFTTAWRWALLASVALFGAAAAAIAGGDAWRRAAWGGGVAALLAWHPVTAECVRLGQVNLVLGALSALAIAAVRREPRARGELWAGALLGLGAAIKLVPGALALPVLATRRWRPAAAAAAVGLVLLALALPVVPLPRVVEAVRATLKFQSSIDPDWLVGQDPAPGWMRFLGFVRHQPLQWITLGVATIVPFARPSARTAAAGMALITAWLGADAAGFHVLYAPLAYPVFVLLAGEAETWSEKAAILALGVVFYGLAYGPASLGAEPRMVLFGLVAWAAAARALGRAAAAVAPGAIEADPAAKQAGIAGAGVLVGLLLAGAVPGEGPVAAPLPEGRTTPEGPGFIHANDRVPGDVHGLGAGMERPASTLARPGTIRALQLYLRSAPVDWRALAERYPARASLLSARADAVPGGDLRDHSGREIAAWLTEEEAAVKELQGEGLDLGDVPRALGEALKSGLTDPELATRVEEEGR